jgi:UDP-3-O-[3-hydroxymyristoyl] N-acetylglucosamine deacetylase
MRSFPRNTLSNDLILEGRGLHSGEPVSVRLMPGENGIGFHSDGIRTIAHPANVTDTTRSTKLGSIGTVEHFMAAFAGLEITDLEIEVDGPEMPALDGSSAPLVASVLATGLENIGIVELPDLYTRVFLQEDGGITGAVAKGVGHWRYVFATDARWPHEQTFERDDIVTDFTTEIAPARTFAFTEEIPVIIQMGLAKGLDEKSALILGIEGYKNEPRFPDEPARHKLLDLIGDLYLTGVPLRALSVVAQRTGHRTNVMLAGKLAHAMGTLG